MADLAFLARHPLLRRFLMPGAAVIAFLVFLILTFPYQTLARRLEAEARSGGAELGIGSMGPAGFFGVRARGLRLKLAPPPGGEPPPELRFDRADLKPDL